MQLAIVKTCRLLMCCALVGALSSSASPTVRLAVVEGDGVTYRTASRAARGISVAVTDEAGNAVENAAVTFQLPADGPSGTFTSGLRTQTVSTGPDGRATVWGMQWNKLPGRVEIRVTAVKDGARAGLVIAQHLNNIAVPQPGGEGVFRASHSARTKWLVIGALTGGAAAAGMAFGHSQGAKASPVAAPVGLSIGTPSIIVGRP